MVPNCPLLHCPPLPYRADVSTPAFSTPPFLTVPLCPLPQIPSTQRKYHKGRLVEGQWVVGEICRETKDVFLAVCPENRRNADTLLDIIERHVNKDSTVITDCWRGYSQLDVDSWQHLTVNHQYNFVGMYIRFTMCDVIFYVGLTWPLTCPSVGPSAVFVSQTLIRFCHTDPKPVSPSALRASTFSPSGVILQCTHSEAIS